MLVGLEQQEGSSSLAEVPALLGYAPFVYLMTCIYLILTDSGGS